MLHLSVGQFKAGEVSFVMVPLRPNTITEMSDGDVELVFIFYRCLPVNI